ncbi:MAG: lipoyl-dependent peroxiredoxin [Actinomycetota bacterium]|jgi:osmotically inducible protein OsmC|nr:lipoyl-dependent peroxiredoxin [Actinomycetota bacterium]
MPARTANARWEGGLKDGKGNMRLGGGAFEGQYSFSSRFEEGAGTNPEELIAAAHAGCFSMALSAGLERAGHSPNSVETEAKVHLSPSDGGFKISRIDLVTTADVPGIEEDAFQQAAQAAKEGCPVSKALSAVEITLAASLAG